MDGLTNALKKNAIKTPLLQCLQKRINNFERLFVVKAALTACNELNFRLDGMSTYAALSLTTNS